MKLWFATCNALLAMATSCGPAEAQLPTSALWGGLQAGMTPQEAATILSKIEGISKARAKSDGLLIGYQNHSGVPLFGVNTTIAVIFSDGHLNQVILTTERECSSHLQSRVSSFGSALATKYGIPPTADGSMVTYSNADTKVVMNKLDLGIPQLPEAPTPPPVDNAISNMQYNFEVINWKEQARKVTDLISSCSSSGGDVGVIQITYMPISTILKQQSDAKASSVLENEQTKKAADKAAKQRADDASKM